jgi:hypothetical protein
MTRVRQRDPLMLGAVVGAVPSPSVAGFVCEVVVPDDLRTFRGRGNHVVQCHICAERV